METWATLVAATVLAVVPALPRFVPPLQAGRRRWAMSAAGGFSVAFVFLELLPQVIERADPVADGVGALLPFVDHEVLFVLLVGLTVFYALERMAARSREPAHGRSTGDWAGFVSTAAFGGYASVIGYLLWAQVDRGLGDLALFTVAAGLHFFVVDMGLEMHHHDAYRRVGRWVLSGAVLAGCLVGAAFAVPRAATGMMLSFVGGGVILITLKEELPSEKEGRVTAFTAGALAYVALGALG